VPCVISGNNFSLTMKNIQIEGEVLDAVISGSAEDDKLQGKFTLTRSSGVTISSPLTGTRNSL
jgi:hypothetical protein